MKRFNIKSLLLLLSIIIITVSCNSNKDNNKKEENKKNTVDVEEKRNDIAKSNEPVDANMQDEKESTPIRNDKTLISINQIRYNPKAVELNNIAMESIKYTISPINSKDTLILIKAIEMLDKAIKIDSLYNLAYANKVMVLKRLNKEKEALHVLSVITKLRPDYAEGFSMLGFTYEKLGNIDSANIKYKSAIIAYSHRIEQTNNVSDKINRAFILSLIDKGKGLQEMDYLIEENPDDETIGFWKQQLFDEFDREKFISKQ